MEIQTVNGTWETGTVAPGEQGEESTLRWGRMDKWLMLQVQTHPVCSRRHRSQSECTSALWDVGIVSLTNLVRSGSI